MNKKSKYLQVEKFLRGKIESGEWGVGMKIPTIRELIPALNASDTTIIKALSLLSSEGLIVKRQGSGTYVSEINKIDMPNPGKSFRFGLLWNESVSPTSLVNNFRYQIVQGLLSCLNIKTDPIWHDRKDHQETQVTWTSKDHRFIVDIIGEPQNTILLHPSLRSVQDVAFDGLISLGISHQKWLTKILELRVPTVIVDFPNDKLINNADHLNFDPEIGYRQATQYFIDNDFKNIHFIGELIFGEISEKIQKRDDITAALNKSFIANPDSELRRSVVERTLNQNYRYLNKDQIHYTNINDSNCAGVISTLLQMPNAVQPDAIICHNHNIAKAIVEGFAKAGKTLVGVGATSNIANLNKPGIIYADLFEYGKISAELLISKIKQPNRVNLCVGAPMKFVSHNLNHLNALV